MFIVGIGDEADNQTFVLAIVGHPTIHKRAVKRCPALALA
jgi:hypothetical protein